jgi:hypothetical protein
MYDLSPKIHTRSCVYTSIENEGREKKDPPHQREKSCRKRFWYISTKVAYTL